MRCRWLAIGLLIPGLAGHAGAEDLAGRVWVPDEARFTDPAEVEQAAAQARYVLLGEEHANARHHALQARLIRAAAKQRRPAVVFEMIPSTGQAEIDAWRQRPNPAASELGPAVHWQQRGWPDWDIYRPIAEAALEQDLPLIAGAPSVELLRTVARSGLDGLTAQRRSALGLDRPLPDAGRERLLATLREVHCGESHVPAERMLAIQRLRDAAMAESLRQAAGDGAALIAGHGHVRRDYGIPRYFGETEDVVAIAFRATGGIGPRVADHVTAAGGELAYDYVWFTEGRVQRRSCDES